MNTASNTQELLALLNLGIDLPKLSKQLYKETKSGVSLQELSDGLTLCGCVEGSEAEPFRKIEWPITAEEFWALVEDLDAECCALWEEANRDCACTGFTHEPGCPQELAFWDDEDTQVQKFLETPYKDEIARLATSWWWDCGGNCGEEPSYKDAIAHLDADEHALAEERFCGTLVYGVHPQCYGHSRPEWGELPNSWEDEEE